MLYKFSTNCSIYTQITVKNTCSCFPEWLMPPRIDERPGRLSWNYLSSSAQHCVSAFHCKIYVARKQLGKKGGGGGQVELIYICFDHRCSSSSRRWILPSVPGPASTTYSPPTSTPSSTAFGQECRQASSSGSVTCSWRSRETASLIVPAFPQGQGL